MYGPRPNGMLQSLGTLCKFDQLNTFIHTHMYVLYTCIYPSCNKTAQLHWSKLGSKSLIKHLWILF